jgi:hypothetical protein
MGGQEKYQILIKKTDYFENNAVCVPIQKFTTPGITSEGLKASF